VQYVSSRHARSGVAFAGATGIFSKHIHLPQPKFLRLLPTLELDRIVFRASSQISATFAKKESAVGPESSTIARMARETAIAKNSVTVLRKAPGRSLLS
jgi:hypothetical protein